MNEYPSQVTLYEDGVFRWSYDLDLWHNRYILKVIFKVIFLIIGIPAGFLLLMILKQGVPLIVSGMSLRETTDFVSRDLKTLGILVLLFVGCMLLVLLIYALCAWGMKGVYHLCFEMDETAVSLVRSAKTTNTMIAFGAAATLATLAAGESGAALRNGAITAGAANSGTTPFSSVTRVKRNPQNDLIELREWFGMNQIYVCPENYDAVLDFILKHVREKVRR